MGTLGDRPTMNVIARSSVRSVAQFSSRSMARVSALSFSSKTSKTVSDDLKVATPASDAGSLPTQVAHHAAQPIYITQLLDTPSHVRAQQLSTIVDTFSLPASNIDFGLCRHLSAQQVEADVVTETTVTSAVEEDAEADVLCESVLRKRKRKMNKHKLQKRRWRERMLRRQFGR